MRGVALAASAALCACSFTPGTSSTPGDGGASDGEVAGSVTVGFASATSLTDETAGTLGVRVVLSGPAEAPVTVDYAFADGAASTADRPGDYVASDGTLTFAPGDVEQVIELAVQIDGVEEPDETVRIDLSRPSSGASLATSAHTVTISASTLPRINFALAASTANEASSPALEVTLDKASVLPVSATLALTGGTATAGGTDVALAATTVTFQPGDTSALIELTVTDDALDENDETAIVAIQNPVNVISGATTSRTHTITDDDNPPDVGFAAATSMIAEMGGGVDVTVSLTGASGKTVTVPFSVDGASSAVSTDFAIPTASPLTFAPGETTKLVRIDVVDDDMYEPSETVVLSLGSATNAGAGAITTHTVTVTDDDSVCLGTGSYRACVAKPTAARTLPDAGSGIGVLDTSIGGSALCASPVSDWMGQPDACFVVATDLTISGLLSVIGNRPLVLFATGNLQIQSLSVLDVAGHSVPAKTAPGSQLGCGAYTVAPVDDPNGGGGGAGGSFMTVGGGGGGGNNKNGTGGTALAAASAPTTLRGGCQGQLGGNGPVNNGGQGGEGGGAVYLVAGGAITMSSGSVINASGAAGIARTNPGSGFFAGGGGGGSGGMIVLDAPTISAVGAILMANGGGGSSGGDVDSPGNTGQEASVLAPLTAALGGSNLNTGGAGGAGSVQTTPGVSGIKGTAGKGGGGGGGGGGYIQSNLPLTGATVSAGAVQ